MISPGATILPFGGTKPDIDPTVFVADGARIIGRVTIGRYSSVWFNTVIRGDVHTIDIGDETNIQDGCVLHVTRDRFALRIAPRVTVGHSVTLHGCTVEEESLIGIGATVLDGAIVRTHSMVAGGALIPPGMEVPSGHLVGGVPAKVMRKLTAGEIENLSHSADNYRRYAKKYMDQLRTNG